MPIICGGLLVCSQQEVNYNTLGVVCVVGATVLRAIKTVMQEKLLDPKEKDLDSVSLLYYLAPWAGASLLVMSLCFEGLAPFTMLLPSDSGGDKKRSWHSAPVAHSVRPQRLLPQHLWKHGNCVYGSGDAADPW